MCCLQCCKTCGEKCNEQCKYLSSKTYILATYFGTMLISVLFIWYGNKAYKDNEVVNRFGETQIPYTQVDCALTDKLPNVNNWRCYKGETFCGQCQQNNKNNSTSFLFGNKLLSVINTQLNDTSLGYYKINDCHYFSFCVDSLCTNWSNNKECEEMMDDQYWDYITGMLFYIGGALFICVSISLGLLMLYRYRKRMIAEESDPTPNLDENQIGVFPL